MLQIVTLVRKKTTFAIWPRKRALWGKLESAIKGFWGLESNLFIDIGKALEIYYLVNQLVN